MKFFDPYFDFVDCPQNLRSFLLTELQSTSRHWHGVTHHALMLGLIDIKLDNRLPVTSRARIVSPNGNSVRLLIWATLFHDIVYDATRTDNEEMSAVTAELWLAGHLPPNEMQKVKDLILATKKHDFSNASYLTKTFLWMDLSVLWGDTKLYRFYARGIRKEYWHVPDADYALHRPKVMKHILEECRGFISEDEYNDFARNLAWETSACAAGEFNHDNFDGDDDVL